ncbi:hypothetical protein GCM10027568_00890 [Humibacter soli]
MHVERRIVEREDAVAAKGGHARDSTAHPYCFSNLRLERGQGVMVSSQALETAAADGQGQRSTGCPQPQKFRSAQD